MNRSLHMTIALALAGALAAGCALDAKGEEEAPFDDELEEAMKADSFRLPTEHGELTFGVGSQVSFEEGALFHAWTFSLSDDASVALATELRTPNLDTVLYLYRRDAGTERWGRYLARNDDANPSTVASRIERELRAGEYRMIVKGFKTTLRGDLAVNGTCDGAGCPGVAGDCSVDAIGALPSSSVGMCGLVSDALAGTVASSGRTNITLEERCALPEAARTGVDHYYAYWNDIAGWDDAFPSYDGEPVTVEVEWRMLDNGAAFVGVDGGGDEAAMDFLYGPDGALLYYYQHNQSPDFAFLCDGGDAVDEECGRLMVDALLHDASGEREGSVTVTGADAGDRLERAVFLAYEEYVRANGLGASVAVDVDFVVWDNLSGYGWETAGRVTAGTAGQPTVTYELATESTTQWLFTKAENGAEAAVDCREL